MLNINDSDLRTCVASMKSLGAGRLPSLLEEPTRIALLTEFQSYELTEQAKLSGEYKVRQEFASFDRFPEHSTFLKVRDELARVLNERFTNHYPGHLSEPLVFTRTVAQQYEPGPLGISPHKDGKSYINLVAILVLGGHGTFSICENREGAGAVPLQNEPGDLLLMRAPGFCGGDIQPFHTVTDITERRTSFSLRHRERPN